MYYLSIHYLTQLFIHHLSLLSTCLSIGLSVLSIIDQPIYLHYLSSISLPFLSIKAATHHLCIQKSIHPLNHRLSRLSIHPFNHHLSIMSIHLSLLPTYHLFLLSVYVIYHLSIYLSVQPTYLYVIYLSTSIYVSTYHLSIYLSIFTSIHASTAVVLNWG